MSRTRHDVAITILQWAIGIIIFIESCLTFRESLADLRLAEHIRHLLLIRLLTSGVEAIAAILFLIPKTMRAGGWTLIVIFIWAFLFHSLHGTMHELPLLIFGAGVYAVITWKGQVKA